MSNRLTQIAEAVVAWPLELCSIVADYAVPDVRWSTKQLASIDISADRTTAKLTKSVYTDESIVDSVHYYELVAESTIRESASNWTLRFKTDRSPACVVFRIGVLTVVDRILSPKIRLETDGPDRTVSWLKSSLSSYDVDFPQATVRFTLSADLKTSRLSGTIWSTTAAFPPIDWFSTDMKPAVLAAAVPVVYFYGVGSTAELVSDNRPADEATGILDKK